MSARALLDELRAATDDLSPVDALDFRGYFIGAMAAALNQQVPIDGPKAWRAALKTAEACLGREGRES